MKKHTCHEAKPLIEGDSVGHKNSAHVNVQGRDHYSVCEIVKTNRFTSPAVLRRGERIRKHALYDLSCGGYIAACRANLVTQIISDEDIPQRRAFNELVEEIQKSAEWIKRDFDNSAIINSEIRALRAAADKLEQLNQATYWSRTTSL